MIDPLFKLTAALLLIAAFTHASALPAGRIIVNEGPVDHQLIQRDAEGKGQFTLTGVAESPANAALDFRILRRSQVVTGLDWTPIEILPEGNWSVNVKEIPTGGPYRIEMRLRDSSGATIDDHDVDGLLVGDLWVLAGQSNMDGTGDLAEAEPPHEMVHVFNLADHWQVAEDPMHWCYESIYPVYLTSYVTPTQRRPIEYIPRGAWPDWKTPGNHGAGLGIPFGKTIYEHTGVPVGLILCSLGGSSMQQWSPDLRDQGGNALYSAMLMRIDKVGGRIKGVLWYQGESDTNSGSSRVYQERLTRLMESIRADQQNPAMPFYIVQLARMVGGDESKPEEVNAVRAAHLAVGSSTNNSATVAALDLGMSSGSHLDTDGYKRVGKRLARVALADVYEVESIRFGPKLIGVKVEGTTTHPMLRVQFEDVNGRLSPDARVAGFTIRGQDGSKIVVNHLNAAVNPDSPDEVLITCDMSIPPDASLWYGYGWNPYCNLTDEADMAAPAFGPVRLEAK